MFSPWLHWFPLGTPVTSNTQIEHSICECDSELEAPLWQVLTSMHNLCKGLWNLLCFINTTGAPEANSHPQLLQDKWRGDVMISPSADCFQSYIMAASSECMQAWVRRKTTASACLTYWNFSWSRGFGVSHTAGCLRSGSLRPAEETSRGQVQPQAQLCFLFAQTAFLFRRTDIWLGGVLI